MERSLKNRKSEGEVWIKAMAVYAALVVCFYCLVSFSQEVICSGRALGIITDISREFKDGSERAYYITKVSFTAQDGKTYEVGQSSGNYPSYKVNQTVEVGYDPSRPEIFYLLER